MSDEKAKAWMTLSADPVTERIEIVGFTPNPDELPSHRERTDAAYLKTFEVSETFGNEIFVWLRSCGIASSEARNIIREIGKMAENIFDGPDEVEV